MGLSQVDDEENKKLIHDKHILRKTFKPGQSVLVYDSRFHLFPGKFKSRWFGPCTVQNVWSNGAVQVKSPSEGMFTVNGQRLKHYQAGDPITCTEEAEEEEDQNLDISSSELPISTST